MALSLEKGADIVISRWCKVQSGEKVLIVSDENHSHEGMALWRAVDRRGASAILITIPEDCAQAGVLFESMHGLLLQHQVIIGATNFSLITNKTVLDVVSKGGRFLSLPLSSNNGKSTLTFNFMEMDPAAADTLSQGMRKPLQSAETLHVTTDIGTDLTFHKNGRKPGLFNGLADEPGKIGSSSFEIYIGIEETKTNGHAVLDGSLGYLGCPPDRIHLTFKDGLLVEIEHNDGGNLLGSYLESFKDPRIYTAGEFGIGLNKKSRCCGNCYIEDESAYSTFHIGMGRNLALGGVHDAAGHFDLVFHKSTIYADHIMIMKDGQALV